MCGGGGGSRAPSPPPPPPPPTHVRTQIGGQSFLVPRDEADIPGITQMARGLAEVDLGLPQQQLAGFTPDQQAAFQLAQQGVGSYIPFLQAATGATGAGLSGLAGASEDTQQLAGQIPGQVAPGQASLLGAQGLALGSTGLGVGQLGQAGRATQQLAGQLPGVIGPAQTAAQRAAQTGMQGIGASEALTRGVGAQIPRQVAPGQAALAGAGRMAGGVAAGGIGALSGTGSGFDPSRVQPFMNEFENAAVQQALADIRREGEIAGTGLRAQAVGAGAFGGSRQAVAEQELQRNIMEQQGRTAAQMRTAGFESAAQRSQAAFEDAMRRQQQAAVAGSDIGFRGAEMSGIMGLQGAQLGLSGLQQQEQSAAQAAALSQTAAQLGMSEAQLRAQLGLEGIQTGLGAQQQFAGIAGQQAGLGLQGAQAAGNLGLQSSQLGLAGLQAGLGAQQQRAGIAQAAGAMGQQFAGLGAQQQQQQMADIGMLGDVGRQQQQQAQAALDVDYANQYQRAMMPFQQLAFASDIITGAPSGQSAITTRPGPSVASQALGTGMALSQIGSLFGGS